MERGPETPEVLMKPLTQFVMTVLAMGCAGTASAGEAEALTNGAGVNWPARAALLRQEMARILQFPEETVSLHPETHRTRCGTGYIIESITYASEPGSRVTALLYLPEQSDGPVPGLVLCAGHGGSKSAPAYQYAGQLYAKLGFAVLMPDTIGEEERHKEGKMGTRAHDMYEFRRDEAARRAFTRDRLGRMVLGKLVWDLMRGLDYLETRPEVDAGRLGVLGNSLGGCTAGCVATLDPRVKAAVISGWGMVHLFTIRGKTCTNMPYQAFGERMPFTEMNALLYGPTLVINGAADTILEPDEGGAGFVREVRATLAGARRILDDAGIERELGEHWVPNACHRPYFLTHAPAAWLQRHLVPEHARHAVRPGITVFGDWADANGIELEKLYATEARQRGTRCVDIGAVYYAPEELACFPGQLPAPEYTWAGWVERCTGTDAAP